MLAEATTRPRVLIAEDETIIRLDLRMLLEENGFDVCAEARDGREAVELARTHEPDVAAHCRRIVKMRDGKVWSDEPVLAPRHAQEEIDAGIWVTG